MDSFPWDILGIAPTKDKSAIRKAYSAKLKAMDVDNDVRGYEDLRAARSEALYLATQDDLPQEEPADFSPYGGPAELDPIDASETKLEPRPQEGVDSEMGGEADAPPPSTAPDDLLAILFPAGQQSEEALSAEEYEEALGHMRTVIADARTAQIDMQTAIEHRLAHFLASAWPRSGPLIEEASIAFSWDKDAGRIDEDPAVAFLNGRVELFRRLAQIEDPSHKYHAAWEELKQPGPRGRFRWGQPKADQIVGLVQAIREEYPELENYLDAERVESWIDPKTKGLPGWVITLMILGAFFTFGRFVGPSDSPPPLDELAVGGALNWPIEDQQAVVDAVMGPGIAINDFTADLPNAARIIATTTRGLHPTEAGRDLAETALRNTMRRATLGTSGTANFEQLLVIKTLKRDVLMAARDDGNASCNFALRTGVLPDDLTVSDSFKAKESEAFRMLFDTGLYNNQESPVAETASVPPEIITLVMDRTGMSIEDWNRVAVATEPSRERCDFEIALLDVVLQRPGTVSAELLRMM